MIRLPREVVFPRRLAIALALASVGVAGTAQADRAAAPCTIAGTQVLNKGTKLYAAPTGGAVLGEFSGSAVRLELREIPADSSSRAKLVAIDGAPGLRIEGYIRLSDVQVYAARDLTVHPGHVAIAAGVQVTPSPGTRSGMLTATRNIIGAPAGKSVSAQVACSALTLQRTPTTNLEVPRRARAYAMRKTTIALYERPRGKFLFNLELLDGSAQLFWGTERKRGYRRVQSRDDLAIDAWVKDRELKPLSREETEDLLVRPPQESRSSVAVKMELNPVPATMSAPRDLPVRASKDAAAAPIGLLESGAQVYVMETTLDGWNKVLPRQLSYLPAGGVGFWVQTKR